jgi:hypothetical protein
MRIKFCFEVQEEDDASFFIENFPGGVHQGDLIEPLQIAPDNSLTTSQTKYIQQYAWPVDFVSWEKDATGIYLKAYCIGD